MTRLSGREASVLLILAVLCFVAAGVTAFLHLSTAAVLLAVVGVALVLYVVCRRFGRRGDFNRSGWTGS